MEQHPLLPVPGLGAARGLDRHLPDRPAGAARLVEDDSEEGARTATASFGRCSVAYAVEPTGSTNRTEALCDEAVRYAESDGVVSYPDHNHLGARLSRQLAGSFTDSIRHVTSAETESPGWIRPSRLRGRLVTGPR